MYYIEIPLLPIPFILGTIELIVESYFLALDEWVERAHSQP